MATKEKTFRTFGDSITISKSDLYAAYTDYLVWQRAFAVKQIEQRISLMLGRKQDVDTRSFFEILFNSNAPEKIQTYATRREVLQALLKSGEINALTDINEPNFESSGREYKLSFDVNSTRFVHLAMFAKYTPGPDIELSMSDFEYIMFHLPEFDKVLLPPVV